MPVRPHHMNPTPHIPSRSTPATTKEAAMHNPSSTPTGTTRTQPRRRSLPTRRIAVLGAVGAAGLAFAACGGSSGASTATSAPASPSGSPSGSSTTPSTLPGASGTIAAVSASSLEVQNTESGQTTVNYTSSTVIRQITTTSASAVAVESHARLRLRRADLDRRERRHPAGSAHHGDDGVGLPQPVLQCPTMAPGQPCRAASTVERQQLHQPQSPRPSDADAFQTAVGRRLRRRAASVERPVRSPFRVAGCIVTVAERSRESKSRQRRSQ